MNKTLKGHNVTVLLSLHTTSEDKTDFIKQIGSIPQVELHTDYDKSDKTDKFKLAIISKVLNDINFNKPTNQSELYKMLAELKNVLNDNL